MKSALLFLLLSGFCAAAAAQTFPTRTVTIVVPFPPGGSADAAGRIIGERLAANWKSPVIVDNKPGAGTTIAAAFVASAAPDGHTLFLTGLITHAASAALYRNLRYDAVKSFAPVGLISAAPFILVVHPGVKASTIRELVELGRGKAEGLTYSSSGNGAAPHLIAEMFKAITGTRALHVPFKGTAPALTALLGGQVDFQLADVAALPHMQSGKLRALAVTTARRSSLVPGVPTMAEAGVAGLEAPSYIGLLAPAGTPREVVSAVNRAMNEALNSGDVRQKLSAFGFEPAVATPEQFGALIAADVQKYAKVIQDSNVRID